MMHGLRPGTGKRAWGQEDRSAPEPHSGAPPPPCLLSPKQRAARSPGACLASRPAQETPGWHQAPYPLHERPLADASLRIAGVPHLTLLRPRVLFSDSIAYGRAYLLLESEAPPLQQWTSYFRWALLCMRAGRPALSASPPAAAASPPAGLAPADRNARRHPLLAPAGRPGESLGQGKNVLRPPMAAERLLLVDGLRLLGLEPVGADEAHLLQVVIKNWCGGYVFGDY